MSFESSSEARHATPILSEADRLMVVCNSCRYCEGLCAVFPAMEMRRAFADGDLNYLANLCHNCGACYDDCQFSPPHEFDVNVPRVLATVRNDSYAAYAWPRALSGLYVNNGLWVAVIAAVSVALFVLGCVLIRDPAVLWARHEGPGAFYRIIPHGTMAILFGGVFLYALLAMAMGAINFWRDIGEPAATLRQPGSLWQAFKDAGQLRYLDGGGGGCDKPGTEVRDSRKLYHHLTFYGFMLCFLATVTATFYHYLAGREAPYAWYDLPVVLGSLGGTGIIIGPVGLLVSKLQGPAILRDESRRGMDVAFLMMLFLSGLTGMALLLFRGTEWMGVLLAVHLGVVFALFLTMPYGKFMHGIYRFMALVRYARERQTQMPLAD